MPFIELTLAPQGRRIFFNVQTITSLTGAMSAETGGNPGCKINVLGEQHRNYLITNSYTEVKSLISEALKTKP